MIDELAKRSLCMYWCENSRAMISAVLLLSAAAFADFIRSLWCSCTESEPVEWFCSKRLQCGAVHVSVEMVAVVVIVGKRCNCERYDESLRAVANASSELLALWLVGNVVVVNRCNKITDSLKFIFSLRLWCRLLFVIVVLTGFSYTSVFSSI